jgi:hypothetical protein
MGLKKLGFRGFFPGKNAKNALSTGPRGRAVLKSMNSATVSKDLGLLETSFRTGALQMTHFQKVPAAVWQSQIQQKLQYPCELHSTGH